MSPVTQPKPTTTTTTLTTTSKSATTTTTTTTTPTTTQAPTTPTTTTTTTSTTLTLDTTNGTVPTSTTVGTTTTTPFTITNTNATTESTTGNEISTSSTSTGFISQATLPDSTTVTTITTTAPSSTSTTTTTPTTTSTSTTKTTPVTTTVRITTSSSGEITSVTTKGSTTPAPPTTPQKITSTSTSNFLPTNSTGNATTPHTPLIEGGSDHSKEIAGGAAAALFVGALVIAYLNRNRIKQALGGGRRRRVIDVEAQPEQLFFNPLNVRATSEELREHGISDTPKNHFLVKMMKAADISINHENLAVCKKVFNHNIKLSTKSNDTEFHNLSPNEQMIHFSAALSIFNRGQEHFEDKLKEYNEYKIQEAAAKGVRPNKRPRPLKVSFGGEFFDAQESFEQPAQAAAAQEQEDEFFDALSEEDFARLTIPPRQVPETAIEADYMLAARSPSGAATADHYYTAPNAATDAYETPKTDQDYYYAKSPSGIRETIVDIEAAADHEYSSLQAGFRPYVSATRRATPQQAIESETDAGAYEKPYPIARNAHFYEYDKPDLEASETDYDDPRASEANAYEQPDPGAAATYDAQKDTLRRPDALPSETLRRPAALSPSDTHIYFEADADEDVDEAPPIPARKPQPAPKLTGASPAKTPDSHTRTGNQ